MDLFVKRMNICDFRQRLLLLFSHQSNLNEPHQPNSDLLTRYQIGLCTLDLFLVGTIRSKFDHCEVDAEVAVNYNAFHPPSNLEDYLIAMYID